MNNSLPEFLCIPSVIIKDKDMTDLDGHLYGVIYWYTKQKLQKCILSNPKLGELLGVDPRSIQRSLARLEAKGHIRIIYKDASEKVRQELIPLIQFQQIKEQPSMTKESHLISEDTTVESYDQVQNDKDTTVESYKESIGTTEKSYKYDPTVIEVRPDGHHNKNIQEDKINNINNSSNEELEQLTNEVFGVSDDQREKKEHPEETVAIAEPIREVLEGEVVTSTKAGKPAKGKQQPNPDGTYGKPDINKGMARLEELLGSRPAVYDKNKWALQRMLRTKSIETIVEKLEDAFFVRSHRFAPSISNFIELEKRWHDLDTYYMRHNPKGEIRITQAATNDKQPNIIGGIAW
jgi:hypothetical protein